MKELRVLIKGPYLLESSFTTAYLKGLKEKGFFTHKISDQSMGTKPFDAIVCTTVRPYFIEIKVIDNDYFPINRLRNNQLASLRKADVLNCGTSIVIVYSKKINKYKIIPFSVIASLSHNDAIKLKFDE